MKCRKSQNDAGLDGRAPCRGRARVPSAHAHPAGLPGVGEATIRVALPSVPRRCQMNALFLSVGSENPVIDLPRDIKDVLVADPRSQTPCVRSAGRPARLYPSAQSIGQTNSCSFEAGMPQIAAITSRFPARPP